MKKVEKKPEMVSVIAMPNVGIEDRTVMIALVEGGATSVSLIAPGFISAVISNELIGPLTPLARIEIKPKKQMLNPTVYQGKFFQQKCR